ncbi:hypothetical protein ACQKJC_24620 [Priestia koreensis]|uniref:hypothetical protein n=1 Tax=Priestia koreensis TaxID=284581 RepID=UPI003D050D18
MNEENDFYKTARYVFSQNGHKKALEMCYPEYFKNQIFFLEEVSMECCRDIRGQVLDQEFAVDMIAKTKLKMKESEINDLEIDGFDTVTIQEKVLKPHHLYYDETVTLTVRKENTNQESEWFKLGNISLYVWIYYDKDRDEIVDWIAVENPVRIRDKVRKKEIPFNTRLSGDSNCTFVSIKVADLERHNLISARMDNILH